MDVFERVGPALLEIAARNENARVAIVAHAGVVRAAIALAFASSTRDAPALALSFDVQPLSLTVLQIQAADAITIACTNWCPLC
jgi:alpha-ribazole phosphatase